MPIRILTTVAAIGLFWIPVSVNAEEPPPANKPDSCHISFAPPDDSPENRQIVKENEEKEAACEKRNREQANMHLAWLSAFYASHADGADRDRIRKDRAVLDEMQARIKQLMPRSPLDDAPSPPRKFRDAMIANELAVLTRGEVVKLEIAPVAVTILPSGQGVMYPEPCDDLKERSPYSLTVNKIPAALAKQLNELVDKETDGAKTWTCFDVFFKTTKVTKFGANQFGAAAAAVEGDFITIRATTNARPVNQGILGGD